MSLAVFSDCRRRSPVVTPPPPPIDYRPILEEQIRLANLILAEVSNHNASVTADYTPIVDAIERNLAALNIVAANQAATNQQIKQATETIGAEIAKLAGSIEGFQTATITAFEVMLKAEQDQTQAIIDAAKAKPMAIVMTFSANLLVGSFGPGVIVIPAGANEVVIRPLCTAYKINGDVYAPGHTFTREHRTIGSHYVIEPELTVELPAGAEAVISYTSFAAIGTPALENVTILTQDQLPTHDDDDDVIRQAIANANDALSREV